MADVEVELVIEGSVDLYLSDYAFELIMSDRTLDPHTKDSVYPTFRALQMWVDLGLRNSPVLTEEGKEIYGIETASGKIIGFFSGNQDFIGIAFVKATSTKSVRVSKSILTNAQRIKQKNQWRPRP